MGHFLSFPAPMLGFCGADGMGTARVTWEETRGTMGPFIYLSGSPALRALDTGFACTRRGRGGRGQEIKMSFRLKKRKRIICFFISHNGNKAWLSAVKRLKKTTEAS